MAKTVYYRHCKLQKKNKFQASYLPEEHAVLNKIVKLRDEDGEWDNGWKVTEVSRLRHADKEVPNSHDAIKRHLKSTGDA